MTGVSFAAPADRLREIINLESDRCLGEGTCLFEWCYGKQLCLLPTSDPWRILETMGTCAPNCDLDTAQIIDWLRMLNQNQPFVLIGAGGTFVKGRFTPPVENSRKLARHIFEFCPDAVYDGTGSVAALAFSIKRTREFLLWWD